jgi:hypothetical protein
MLVLFGDSFISESYHKNTDTHPDAGNNEDACDHPTWFKMLSDDLGTEYKTYGRPGSSFEYSTLKFFEYLTSTDYDPTDQIVFAITTSERSPVITKEFLPEWAYLASYKAYPEHLDPISRQRTDKLTKSDEHYTRYKQFYRDWYLLKNQDLIVAQRYFLLQTLHSLPNKTVSISVSGAESSIAKFFPKHAKFSLGQISTEEFSDDDTLKTAKKCAGSYDHRLNHLDEKNHHVLRDAVYAGLTDNNFSDFNAKSFHKNLFSVE